VGRGQPWTRCSASRCCILSSIPADTSLTYTIRLVKTLRESFFTGACARRKPRTLREAHASHYAPYELRSLALERARFATRAPSGARQCGGDARQLAPRAPHIAARYKMHVLYGSPLASSRSAAAWKERRSAQALRRRRRSRRFRVKQNRHFV